MSTFISYIIPETGNRRFLTKGDKNDICEIFMETGNDFCRNDDLVHKRNKQQVKSCGKKFFFLLGLIIFSKLP